MRPRQHTDKLECRRAIWIRRALGARVRRRAHGRHGHTGGSHRCGLRAFTMRRAGATSRQTDRRSGRRRDFRRHCLLSIEQQHRAGRRPRAFAFLARGHVTGTHGSPDNPRTGKRFLHRLHLRLSNPVRQSGVPDESPRAHHGRRFRHQLHRGTPVDRRRPEGTDPGASAGRRGFLRKARRRRSRRFPLVRTGTHGHHVFGGGSVLPGLSRAGKGLDDPRNTPGTPTLWWASEFYVASQA